MVIQRGDQEASEGTSSDTDPLIAKFGQLNVLNGLIHLRAAGHVQFPILAYPSSEEDVASYAYYTGRDLDEMIDQVVGILVESGFRPIRYLSVSKSMRNLTPDEQPKEDAGIVALAMFTTRPLVFSNEVKHYLPEEWYEHILNRRQDYESLRVVSLTRVKNLNSAWGHEYIQFIVEDELSNERARVYAERGVPKSSIDVIAMSVNPTTFRRDSVDGVTIGFNEKGEQGRWNGSHDLPLRLESYIYTAKMPSFISLAETISSVSKKGGTYKPIGNNCYWFAYTVMNDYGEKNKGTPKTVYATIGGRGGGGLHDIISCYKARLCKDYYRKDAEKFNEERRYGV